MKKYLKMPEIMRQPQENVERSTVNMQKLTFFFGQDSCAHLVFQVCLIFKGIWSVRFTGQPCASICMRVCCSVVSSSFAAPRTVALQAALSMGFSRQDYSCGQPFLSPGDFPDESPALQGAILLFEHQGSPDKLHN